MNINVTADHIKRGIKGDPSKNPVALAIQDILNKTGDQGYRATVSYGGRLVIFDVLDWKPTFIENLNIQSFFEKWYANKKVEPFDVTINLM